MTEIIDKIDKPKVVVFTPPPVPPGEAPMHINIIIIVNPSVLIAPVFTELKPVVVEADMAWNVEVRNRSFHDGKGLGHSEMNTSKNPIISSVGSVSNTSFV